MSNQSGNVVLGTLIGAAVGFAAGILLAPAKGSETREILGDKSNDLKKTISDATESAIASLKEVKESAERSIKGEGERVRADAKAKANETARAIKNS